jgi:hypothetical protein
MDIKDSTESIQSMYKLNTTTISYEDTDCEVCTRYVCVCDDNKDVSDVKSYTPIEDQDPAKENTDYNHQIDKLHENTESQVEDEYNEYTEYDEDNEDDDDEDDDENEELYNDDDLDNSDVYLYDDEDSFYLEKKYLRELDEQNEEQQSLDYHLFKNSGDWRYAKMLVNQSYIDSTHTVFFIDYLDKLLLQNADNFNNIKTVYYKHEGDYAELIQFEESESKYLVENLKINEFKPNGILFNSDNKWNFKITVITTKNIYSANRYISDDLIGMY